MGALEHPPIFRLPAIHAFGRVFGPPPDHVTYTWIAMVILVGVALVASRRLELVPRGLQNLIEVVLEQFETMLDDVIGHDGRKYLPLIATLGLFILVSNLMGLIPGLIAPTANLNTTAACALIVFFTYHAIGIRKQGLVTYAKHFMGPVVWLAPLMVPIEVVSHFARPLSLSLRLFGNMTGGHILLAVFVFLMGFDGMLGWALSGSVSRIVLGVPITLVMLLFTVGFLYPLKILVAFLQSFIFAMLSMLYIAGALEEAAHH